MGSYEIGHQHHGNTVTWCDSHSGQTHDKFKTLFYCLPLASNCRYGLWHGSHLSIFQPGCHLPSIKLKGGRHGRRYPLAPCTPSCAQAHPLCRLLTIYWSVSQTRPHISPWKCSRPKHHDTSRLFIPCSLSFLIDIVMLYSQVCLGPCQISVDSPCTMGPPFSFHSPASCLSFSLATVCGRQQCRWHWKREHSKNTVIMD